MPRITSRGTRDVNVMNFAEVQQAIVADAAAHAVVGCASPKARGLSTDAGKQAAHTGY